MSTKEKHQPYLANIKNNPLAGFTFFAVDEQCCAQTSNKREKNDDAHPEVVEAVTRSRQGLSETRGVKATESVSLLVLVVCVCAYHVVLYSLNEEEVRDKKADQEEKERHDKTKYQTSLGDANQVLQVLCLERTVLEAEQKVLRRRHHLASNNAVVIVAIDAGCSHLSYAVRHFLHAAKMTRTER